MRRKGLSGGTDADWRARGVEFIGYVRVRYVDPAPGRRTGLGEPCLSGVKPFSDFIRMSLSPSLRPLTVEPLRAAFRCTTSHWPGTRPRRATFFLVVRQERRQRNVPRCRAPFGGSLLPAMPGGVFANSPCGLRHAKPFFRPSSPPVGAPEGKGNAGDQRPVPDSSSAGARCIRKARSDPAEQRTGRRGLPVRLCEPEGRVPRRPPAGSSAGQSAAGRPGVAGRLLCLLSWRSKKGGRPPGRNPGQRYAKHRKTSP